MSSVVICGGGVVGLCTAMMLARDGVDVTLFEADPAEPPAPGDAWTSWTRKGVAQFRQPHNLFGRFREICDDELPGLTDKLLAAGCVWVDFLESLPPGIGDRAPRPGDDRLRFVTGRRPVVESVLAEAARREPGVTVRRGTRVVGLVQGTAAISGTPHVIGVRSGDGEEIHADLVVDAMGRRSPSAKWLIELGATEPYIESEDCGFVYYTRYFTGPTGPKRITGALTPYGSISLLTLDGDNDTWSVTLFAMSGDPPLKMLRFTDRFDRVVQACPLHAHWLDGEPITDVLAMAGVLDRYRRLRRRRAPDRHRLRGSRGRMGVHESVSRPRDQRRHDPRATPAQGSARASRRSRRLRTGVARLHGGRRAAVLSQPDRGRPSAARRDERDSARG